MKSITFKQFMLTYNFRQYNGECESERNKYNTSIIRINYDDGECTSLYKWFEFGMYDFGCNPSKLELLEIIFSDTILNSYVSDFGYNEELEVFEISLNIIPDIYDMENYE